jgi:hypothetical protein
MYALSMYAHSMTMFIGPSRTAPLEVGFVTDGDGTAIIHAVRASEKILDEQNQGGESQKRWRSRQSVSKPQN